MAPTQTDQTPRVCRAGAVEIGPGKPLAIIAGPCVLESLDQTLQIAELLRNTCAEHQLQLVFKASYDKANRSSKSSPRGPGLAKGLDWLATVKRELDLPITTDIHAPDQAVPAAAVADILQIPAFLCRQSDLLEAAAEAAAPHGRAVNVKKGQFLSPAEMAGPVGKLRAAGCENIMLTERGTFFGYHRLVNDFVGLGDMMALEPGLPVCFDVTHSTQLPGASSQSGGRPDRAPLLARAATAAGVHALFIECHPCPAEAHSDGATQLPLEDIPHLLAACAAIGTAAREHRA